MAGCTSFLRAYGIGTSHHDDHDGLAHMFCFFCFFLYLNTARQPCFAIHLRLEVALIEESSILAKTTDGSTS